MLRAQALQHAHLDADQVGVEHAHQDVGRTGRIGQRTEDVEDGPHAELAAHRRDVLHRRVMVGREHEADAALGHAGGHLARRQLDVGAQRLQHVGAAGLAADAAVAVLGHLGAGGGGDEHRAGGDVEAVRAVAAGADDIDQMRQRAQRHLVAQLAHHLGRGGDLADGFLLHPQASDQRGGDDGRHLAGHDAAHQRQHLVVEDLAVLDDAGQGFGIGNGHGGLSVEEQECRSGRVSEAELHEHPVRPVGRRHLALGIGFAVGETVLPVQRMGRSHEARAVQPQPRIAGLAGALQGGRHQGLAEAQAACLRADVEALELARARGAGPQRDAAHQTGLRVREQQAAAWRREFIEV
mmetsp:Transcript_20777/g.79644  ORF Transcript_20777/g.79644 Transcript_20777/m.79644 type:complete len:352 (-) Transcript_20777:6929-7984(-)